MYIYDLLEQGIRLNASDIHITVGTNPVARVKGGFVKLSEQILTSEVTMQMAKDIAGESMFKVIEEHGEADFSASLKTGERFRVNAYRQKGNYAIAIRTITAEIPTFEKLGLPESIKSFTEKHKD